MQRICCDISVQTDTDHTEQCTQVSVDQCTAWTQCTVSRADQSVQAVCKQSVATVQVASETSNAAVQTEPAVAEPAERSSSTVDEDKLNAQSEIIGHCQVEEESWNAVSAKERTIANSEITDKSPCYCDSVSSVLVQLEEDYSTPPTGAEFISDKSNTLPAQIPVKSETLSAVIEQLPNQYDADKTSQLPTVLQSKFSLQMMPGVCRPAILQPHFNMNTPWKSSDAAEYVYSFEQLEQRTFLASKLMLQRSGETSSVAQGGPWAASVQKIPTRQLVHEIQLFSNSQNLVTQSAGQTTACLALNAKSSNTTDSPDTSSEPGSNLAVVADPSAALKPSPHALDADATFHNDDLSSTNLQQDVFSLHVDVNPDKSQIAVEQEIAVEQDVITTDKLTSSAALPSVPVPKTNNIIRNASFPAIRVTESARMAESYEPDLQCIRPSTHGNGITSQNTSAKGVNLMQLESDCGKFGSEQQNEKDLECENLAVSTCDQLMAGNICCTYARAEDNGVSCVSSVDVTTASTGSGQCSSKEQGATVLSEINSKVVRLNSCTRGRSRRPLFVCRGPLMETAMTLEGSESTSHCKILKDSESGSRKLPMMLLGNF